MSSHTTEIVFGLVFYIILGVLASWVVGHMVYPIFETAENSAIEEITLTQDDIEDLQTELEIAGRWF